MRKKQKVPSAAALEKQCLQLWSLCVRTRDRKCQVSGSDYALQAHHIRSVSHKSTYLDLSNGIALSSKVHCLQKFNPEKFQDTIINTIGDTEYQRLKAKSLQIFKPTVPWLLMMKDELKTTLRNLEEDYGKLGL
jgi:hypothetical protein